MRCRGNFKALNFRPGGADLVGLGESQDCFAWDDFVEEYLKISEKYLKISKNI